MDFDRERAGAIQLIEATIEDHKVDGLRGRIQVTWNAKLIEAVARAGAGSGYIPGRLKHYIELSQPIWPVLSHREKYETILHELAHSVTAHFHGTQVEGHGQEWRAQMRLFGLVPSEIHKGAPGILGTCPCRVRMVVAPESWVVLRRVHEGGRYRCKDCKQVIVFGREEQ